MTTMTITELYEQWQQPQDRSDEEQAELTAQVADAILAAPSRAQIGDLQLMQGSWSLEASRRPEVQAAEDAGDYEALHAALGPRESVTLVSHGSQVHTGEWCTHNPPAGEWGRYERWSRRGRVGHGWFHTHPACRRITQTG